MRTIPETVIETGLAVAQFRREISRRQNRVIVTKSGHESGVFDDPSAIAEAWFTWEYFDRRLVWRAINSDKSERDVGRAEIQAAPGPKRNLILRQKDVENGVPLGTPYVLVQLECVVGKWSGDFAGWIPLGEGLAHSQRWQMVQSGRPIPGVWLLPPSALNPMPHVKEELSA